MTRISESPLRALTSLALLAGAALLAGGVEAQVQVRTPDAFGISPPMRDVPKARPSDGHRLMPEPGERDTKEAPTGKPDPLLPTKKGVSNVAAGVSPAIIASFDGIGGPGQMGGAPPDTNGDVSPLYYAQYVNTSWAVFDKGTGAMLSGFPKAGNSFWSSWSTTSCPSCTTVQKACGDSNDGDPIVKYDRANDRWVFTQFAVPNNRGPDYQCFAVSTTNDPTGSYYLYAYQVLTQFNDYPKLAVWADAYYVTYNMFTKQYQGPGICAYDRASMVAGSASAVQQCTQLSTTYYSILPADWNGTTAPPAGASEYLVARQSATTLSVWRSAVTWSPTPTLTITGPTAVTIASHTRTCNGGTCVPQPGNPQQLDSLADRLMYRFAYRNFGSYEAFVVSHSVDPTGLGTSSGGSGVRWYEFRNTPPSTSGTGIPTLYQQGTFAPSTTQFRWMPSIAQDKTGDIAIGYSLSDSTSVKPSVVVTGRSPDETAGTMRTETIAQTGGGVQTKQNWAGDARWGDYSAMQIDPADDCTFWFTTEYLKSDTTAAQDPNWSTRIVSFKIVPNAPAAPTLTTPAYDQIVVSWTAVPGAQSYTVLRSDGPCPGGTFTVIASGVTGTSYTDNTAVGGNTYSYQIQTVACTTSAASACASATATKPPCTTPGVPTLNAPNTAIDGQIGLTWAAGTPVGATYKVYRSTSSACSVATTLLASGVASTSYTDTSVTPGTTYSYQVTAVDSTGGCESAKSSCQSAAAPGVYSGGLRITARPQDTTTSTLPVRWIYNTPATTVTAPAIGWNTGAQYVVSNDRMLHSVVAGGAGGMWPAGWKPLIMNAPAQSRFAVVPSSISGHANVVYLGAQDGRVYCADAATGAAVSGWGAGGTGATNVLGDVVQGAVSLMRTAWGGSVDALFVGTRNGSAVNALHFLSPDTGALLGSFDNGGGSNVANAIGIISGDPQVDYATGQVYFASRQYAGGSPNTVWCVNAATRAKVWAANVGNVDGSPSLNNGRVYVGTNVGNVVALDAANGNVLWTLPLSPADGPVKGFVWADWTTNNLYCSTNGKVWSIADNGGSGSVNAGWPVAVSNPSMPLVVNGLVIVGGGDGALHQISIASPATQKSVTLGTGAAVVGAASFDNASGLAYVGTDAGDVYSVSLPLP